MSFQLFGVQRDSSYSYKLRVILPRILYIVRCVFCADSPIFGVISISVWCDQCAISDSVHLIQLLLSVMQISISVFNAVCCQDIMRGKR